MHEHTARRCRVRGSIAAAVLAAAAGFAGAQVTPQTLYNGIDREFPVEINVPADARGSAEIRLLEPGSANAVARAAVSSGNADLASLFPMLWSPEPDERPGVLYAQLFVGDEAIGPATVLQPMVSPQMARSQGREIQWQPLGNTFSGIRAYVDRHVVLETTAGEITLRLRPDEAPNMAWNFRHLAGNGYYDGVIFHRIIGARPPRDPFVIQVGDPTGTGTGGPGYMVDLEQSSLEHDFGVLSMARTAMPDTNGSQVFICLSRNGTSFLDGQYTAFGEAVAGAEAIIAIADVEVDRSDRPVGDPPQIVRSYLVDAPPYPQRPDRVARPNAEPTER